MFVYHESYPNIRESDDVDVSRSQRSLHDTPSQTLLPATT